MLECIVCETFKSEEEFPTTQSYLVCYSCWQSIESERQLAQQLTTNKQDRHKASAIHKYGLSLSDYQRMLSQQNWKCQICKADLTQVRPHIDHCHKTNKVRGLLCARCNMNVRTVESHPLVRTGARRQELLPYIEYVEAHEQGNLDFS